MAKKREWREYENVAHELLNRMASEFGLTRVLPDQQVTGQVSGTEWNIEGKALVDGSDIFLIVECRRYTTSKIKQEAVGGLAFRIYDSMAAGGIIVTPLGLQEGAAKVASSQNITTVLLTPQSTTTEYIMTVLHDTWSRTYMGVSSDALLVEEATVDRKDVVDKTPDEPDAA